MTSTLRDEARAEAAQLATNCGKGYANAQRLLLALADVTETASNILRGGPTAADAQKTPAQRIHDAANLLDRRG